MHIPVKVHSVPTITSIQDLITQSANKYGDKLALEDLNDTPIPRLTYGGLLKNILKLGAALRSLGIKERSHVALIG